MPQKKIRWTSVDACFTANTNLLAGTTNLFSQIAAYSSKSLTHQEDALNAFRGLLNRSPSYTYYGIPLIPCLDAFDQPEQNELVDHGFARGLAWIRGSEYTAALSDRKGLPSWSGRVEYSKQLSAT